MDILAVGSGEPALKYLVPYVFRVAISNRNLLALQAGQGTFRFRDSTTNTAQTTLPAKTILGRFLQHVFPRGLQRVRTYGLLHPKQRLRFRALQEQLRPGRPGVVDHPLDAPTAQPTSCRPTTLR